MHAPPTRIARGESAPRHVSEPAGQRPSRQACLPPPCRQTARDICSTTHQTGSCGGRTTWQQGCRAVSTAAATTPAPTTRADDERRPPQIRRIHRRRPQLTQVIPGDARDRSFYPVARLLDPRRAPDAVRCSAPRRDGLTFWGGDDLCSRSGAFRVFAGCARSKPLCVKSRFGARRGGAVGAGVAWCSGPGVTCSEVPVFRVQPATLD
jgi:hypothetical protein